MCRSSMSIALLYFLIGQLLFGCHGDWYPKGSAPSIGRLPALSEDLVRYVNKINTTWKAGINFPGKDASFIKLLLGRKLSTSIPDDLRLPLKPRVEVKEIPEEFDAMEKWPDCMSLGKIRDQGACNAGWAFGAVEAISDRYCIFSQKKNVNITLSAENLIACCGIHCGFGCEGGYPSAAWHYWVQTGIVTGGDFGSSRGCQPYTFPPCQHNCTIGERSSETANPDCRLKPASPVCKRECRKGFNYSYESDLQFGKSAYAVVNDVAQIQEEVLNFGPVEASLDIYEDFLCYKSGIYQHKTGEFITEHSVKLYGWGVTSDGVKYWRGTNSWNKTWGEKGFFRILRGTNECSIEENVHAGLPKL